MMRCFELTAAPGDPVLVEPRWVVLELPPGNGLSAASVFTSLEDAQRLIKMAQGTWRLQNREGDSSL